MSQNVATLSNTLVQILSSFAMTPPGMNSDETSSRSNVEKSVVFSFGYVLLPSVKLALFLCGTLCLHAEVLQYTDV